MNEELFNNSLVLASRLVDRGDHEDAAVVLETWLDTDLANPLKGIVCVNLATVANLQGNESGALAWYDRGIEYDHSEGSLFVVEQKAAYLASKGRKQESLVLYEWLYADPNLTPEDRNRFAHNVNVLRSEIQS